MSGIESNDYVENDSLFDERYKFVFNNCLLGCHHESKELISIVARSDKLYNQFIIMLNKAQRNNPVGRVVLAQDVNTKTILMSMARDKILKYTPTVGRRYSDNIHKMSVYSEYEKKVSEIGSNDYVENDNLVKERYKFVTTHCNLSCIHESEELFTNVARSNEMYEQLKIMLKEVQPIDPDAMISLEYKVDTGTIRMNTLRYDLAKVERTVERRYSDIWCTLS